jgi:hypothetical protein
MTMWKIKRLIYRVKRVIEFIPVIWYRIDLGLDEVKHNKKINI